MEEIVQRDRAAGEDTIEAQDKLCEKGNEAAFIALQVTPLIEGRRYVVFVYVQCT